MSRYWQAVQRFSSVSAPPGGTRDSATAVYAIGTFRKQSQEVNDQALMLKVHAQSLPPV